MAGKRKLRRVYWDSCVFYAWIKKEDLPEDITKGIAQVVEQVYANQTIIATSAITKAEVLEARLTPDQRERFNGIFSHPNIQLLNVDDRVAGKAAVIRNHYWEQVPNDPNGKTMRLGDAFQLATALHYEVGEFHTLDGRSRNANKFHLLNLGGEVAGVRLRICLPYYIEPPKPLEGPVKAAEATSQPGLFDTLAEETGSTPAETSAASEETNAGQAETNAGQAETNAEGAETADNAAVRQNAAGDPGANGEVAEAAQRAVGSEDDRESALSATAGASTAESAEI